jgi:predicted dehydrogenase
VDGFKQNITLYSHADQRPTWHFWGSDMNLAMVAEFVAAIRAGRQPSVTGLDGYRAVEATLAAYESARTGQPVRVG